MKLEKFYVFNISCCFLRLFSLVINIHSTAKLVLPVWLVKSCLRRSWISTFIQIVLLYVNLFLFLSRIFIVLYCIDFTEVQIVISMVIYIANYHFRFSHGHKLVFHFYAFFIFDLNFFYFFVGILCWFSISESNHHL